MKKNITIYIIAIISFACSSSKKTATVNRNTNIINKYSQTLGVAKKEITNIKLYQFINSWTGVKYKYGGLSRKGVDCSGFCNILYQQVYSKQLKRTTTELAKSTKKISKKNLQEGDLVFFTIASKKNSHVGVYLQNNKFVHASTSKGVIISSLDNPYYKKAYHKAGRVK